jgi:hypothetical protein
MRKYCIIFFLWWGSSFAVDKVLYPDEEFPLEPPWLTGPLIAPSSVVMPPGSWNVQPYIFATFYTGFYDSNWHPSSTDTFFSTTCQIPIQVGICPRLDFQFIPGFSWNYTQHQSSWVLNDLPIGFDIQLYDNHFIPTDPMPSIKLILREIIPLGRYDRLDPAKLNVDAGGLGSWITGVGLAFGKLVSFGDVYFMNARFTIQYNLPSKVELKGFNAYGGGFGTDATYFPSQSLFFDLGLEFTLSQNWAVALDLLGSYFLKPHYSGSPGINPDGSIAQLITFSQMQYSIAPAIEYNWSPNWGIIAGAWLTVAGRNASQFFSGVLAINYSK